jgi:hypothetical protein
MTTVAVMQPYFMPYAGYYRLFEAADVFVMFDCVQFPRRGWVHRNRFPLCDGRLDWLTLPVARCARETRIDELAFAPDADARLVVDIQRFPELSKACSQRSALLDLVTNIGTGTLADYLCGQLRTVAAMLGLSKTVIRSSQLSIDAGTRGQARVIAIAKAIGATRYVNSPGGRELYDAQSFADHGIELKFLNPFQASTHSVLTLLLADSAANVASMIRHQTTLSS